MLTVYLISTMCVVLVVSFENAPVFRFLHVAVVREHQSLPLLVEVMKKDTLDIQNRLGHVSSAIIISFSECMPFGCNVPFLVRSFLFQVKILFQNYYITYSWLLTLWKCSLSASH